MKRAIRDGKVIPTRGEAHVQWRGGPEASKLRNKHKRAQINKRYRQANPAKVREWKSNRRGKYLERLPRGTIQRIFELQRGCCAICRRRLSKGFHKDHIMPLARGGEHVPLNIQLLCGPCNVRKSAKDPIEYMQSLGRLL